MIPKVIHYVWLGNKPYPSQIQECIDSWKLLEDKGFVFQRWDETNFDINMNEYTKDLYGKGIYAYVADYIRLYVLYHYGGIYLDTDIKILKPFDEFILDREYLLSNMGEDYIHSCVLGCEKGNPIFKKVLDYYDKVYADKPYDLSHQTVIDKVIPKALGDEMKKLEFLPSDYFAPRKMGWDRYDIKPYTYCVHLITSTWLNAMANAKIRDMKCKET